MQKELEKTNYEKARAGTLDNLLQIPVTAIPNWTDAEKQVELVFKGLAQPSGQTEPLLHAWRLKVKAA